MNVEAFRESLYESARQAGGLGDAMLKSWSGADQADSEIHFCERRVYVAVADGADLEGAIAVEDKRWRAYAVAQAAKVDAAPRIKRGPSRGHSVIAHRWVDPDKFQSKAIHIRAMVRIAREKSA